MFLNDVYVLCGNSFVAKRPNTKRPERKGWTRERDFESEKERESVSLRGRKRERGQHQWMWQQLQLCKCASLHVTKDKEQNRVRDMLTYALRISTLSTAKQTAKNTYDGVDDDDNVLYPNRKNTEKKLKVYNTKDEVPLSESCVDKNGK